MSKTDKLTELENRVAELEQARSPQITQADVEAYLDKLPVSRRQLLGAVAAGTVSLPLLYADIARAQQGGDGDPYACVWLGDQDANDFALDNLGSLNGADIANAASGQVIESDGDGTLSFGADDTGGGGASGAQPDTTLAIDTSIQDTTKLPGVLKLVPIQGIVYAICAQSPGRIVAIDPSGPSIIDNIQTTNDYTIDADYTQNTLFVAHDSGGSSGYISSIDIERPGNMVKRDELTNLSGRPHSVNVTGDLAILTCVSGDDHVVVDISDPDNMQEIYSESPNISSGKDSWYYNDYLFIPDSDDNRLAILDVEDPFNVSWDNSATLSTLTTPLTAIPAPDGKTVAVPCAGTEGVAFFDITDPENVTVSAELEDAKLPEPQEDGIWLGDYLLVTNDEGEGDDTSLGMVTAIDASDPSNPSVVNSVEDAKLQGARAIESWGTEVYVGAGGYPKKSGEDGSDRFLKLDVGGTANLKNARAESLRGVQAEFETVGAVHANHQRHRTRHGAAQRFSVSDIINLPTRGADPSADELPEGKATLYVSDGTADVAGSDGDIILAVNNGGSVTASVFLDNSAGTDLSELAALTAKDTGTVDSTYGTSEADVIKNNRTRIDEIESRLSSLGFIP